MLASPLHLSSLQRTTSTPPLSSSGFSHRSARLKTSNPCNHRNQQYSIIGLTNAAGTLVERYSYTAYGTLGIYDASGTVRTSSTYANRYTYTGREYDADLKLYHFRARWYDPATGGFVSRDPLGYVDGMSLYRGYFAVDMLDPTGQLSTYGPSSEDELIGRQVNGNDGDHIFQRRNGTCYIIKFSWIKGWSEKFDVPCPTTPVSLLADPLVFDKDKRVVSLKSADIAWDYHRGVEGWNARIKWDFWNGSLQKNLHVCGRKGECIKHLTIMGHGNCDGSAGFKRSEWESLLQGVIFCKDCEIKIYACHSGVAPEKTKKNPNPESVAATVARITGCRTYGTKGYTSGFGTGMTIWPTFVDYGDDIGGITKQGKPLFKGKDCYQEFAPLPCFPRIRSGKD